MPRYCSHTIILPDETRLDDHVVEVNGVVDTYYPFAGEVHTTIYIDTPILLSHRADLGGKTIALTLLTWAMRDESSSTAMYAYRLTPCPSCAGDRYTMTRL